VSVAAALASPVPGEDGSAGIAPVTPAQASPASIIVSQVPLAGQKIVAGAVVSLEVR